MRRTPDSWHDVFTIARPPYRSPSQIQPNPEGSMHMEYHVEWCKIQNASLKNERERGGVWAL